MLEHPDLMRKALRTCRKRLIIVSPWLSTDVVDAAFLDQVEKALKRGVEIFIGWGIPPRRQPTPHDRDQERRSEKAAERLKLLGRGSRKGRLHVVRLGDTHEKVLIADIQFAVVTSFNFLSFRGDPSRALREETGVYFEQRDKIEELGSRILERIEKAELVESA
jgi:phosphatidylserine/phosphatidylglycerophosphate/cardiolipin synthase-like enzyme